MNLSEPSEGREGLPSRRPPTFGRARFARSCHSARPCFRRLVAALGAAAARSPAGEEAPFGPASGGAEAALDASCTRRRLRRAGPPKRTKEHDCERNKGSKER